VLQVALGEVCGVVVQRLVAGYRHREVGGLVRPVDDVDDGAGQITVRNEDRHRERVAVSRHERAIVRRVVALESADRVRPATLLHEPGDEGAEHWIDDSMTLGADDDDVGNDRVRLRRKGTRESGLGTL